MVKVKTKNTKGIFTFKGKDGKQYKLTLKEKRFCELYLEFSGNGTEAAFEVYDIKGEGKKALNTAGAIAYERLRKPQIMAYITLKLEEYGFNDENVKKHHLFIMNQFSNLQAKNKAIDMYYKKKGKYAPKKLELSINETDQAPPESDSDIDKIADEAEEKIITIHLHGKHPQTKRIRKKEGSSLDT